MAHIKMNKLDPALCKIGLFYLDREPNKSLHARFLDPELSKGASRKYSKATVYFSLSSSGATSIYNY